MTAPGARKAFARGLHAVHDEPPSDRLDKGLQSTRRQISSKKWRIVVPVPSLQQVAMAALKQFALPDGSEISCRSRTEFDLLCREFLRDSIYRKHDIELNDGDCVFDVGANIGFFTRDVNESIQGGTVYCFEPIPDTFACLERNLRDVSGVQVRLFNCGISDQLGTAEFKYYPLLSVNSTMMVHEVANARRNARRYVLNEIRARHPILRRLVDATPGWSWWPITETIRCIFDSYVRVVCQLRTLSDVIDEYQVLRIDLLKIDVEGAEQAVLDGLREEHWPRVRQMIVETHHGRGQADDIAGQLRQGGYLVAIDRIVRSGATGKESSGTCGENGDTTPESLHMLYARREVFELRTN